MAKIKYQIRSEVKGKLVPIYLYYQDSNNHFRIKTDFKVKQEYWNATKEIIKPIYFDENNFSIEQLDSVEQSLKDLKSKFEREITIGTSKGLTITREYVNRIINQFFNKVPEEEKKKLCTIVTENSVFLFTESSVVLFTDYNYQVRTKKFVMSSLLDVLHFNGSVIIAEFLRI